MDDSKTLSYSQVFDDETVKLFGKEFSRLKDECYLDHAGTTLYTKSQINEISENLLSSLYANPHSLGVASNLTYDTIEQIRLNILEHFHTTSEEYSIIFTSGATAALKTVAETFDFGNKNDSPGHFVYLQDNHTSVLGMRELVVKKNAEITCISKKKSLHIFNKFYKQMETDLPRENNSLFVYSAQCNFSGVKYPLHWIDKIHNGALDNLINDTNENWYVLLDAAAFAATNDLNLSIFKPDFVCVSFYKMFGLPTGIGALLVRNSSSHVLKKEYYGGGTVNIALSMKMFHIKKKTLYDRFEDGTIPFLSIISLQTGLKTISTLSMKKISKHVFSLARHLHHSLMVLHHSNGLPVVKLYADTNYEDENLQGGIVTFNVLRSNGEYVGYMEVLNMAALYKIHLRTGCFCNPGACQRHLNLSNEELLENYDAGYVCGGTRDLINGKPTGAVRISFGYMSDISHVETVLKMIKQCFIDGPEVIKFPDWWENSYEDLNVNYYDLNSVMYENISSFKVNSETENNRKIKTVEESNCFNGSSFKLEKPLIANSNFETDVKNKTNMKLKRLFIYPIKSCGAYEIENSWVLGRRGLKYDREWMVVTSSGICLTQKQEIKMCLIKPNVCLEKRELILSFPGMPDISVPLIQYSAKDIEGKLCRGKICGHKVEGLDCGVNVSEWLSLALGRPRLRLIRQSTESRQSKTGSNKPELSFASQAQYLLLNELSLSWLADKVPESADFQKETMIYRFRGNIIISGDYPFQETEWRQIKIGEHEFQVYGPCTRCQMICIDQTTGNKTVEPLRSLASELHGKIRFGIYLSRKLNNEIVLKIGDIVHCLRHVKLC